MATVKEGFERDLAQVHWRELRIHLRRDALVTVAGELDVVTVATTVASDDAAQVEAWIGAGQLSKPSAADLEAWETSPDKPFLMLIVQPYILIQTV